ncbi:hypothetical protein RvY_18201 [Ramazzottius varieornatus]|uniref:Uncharacterized protein n=1 Tax=Ramazzottius varieornatus TaxID=947166 RepID=A0A1D1W4W2_RAMVA|nr:hypothetical protein RvY_18201 [Ramazzottius varieornatus]
MIFPNSGQRRTGGDSRVKSCAAYFGTVQGSEVIFSSWSGARVVDVLVSTQMMLGVKIGTRGVVLTFGINDVLTAFKNGRFHDPSSGKASSLNFSNLSPFSWTHLVVDLASSCYL